MRTLPHNALELGPLAGPWIDATAFDEHHVTLAELDAAAAFPADWSRILDARPFTGVTAIIHDFVRPHVRGEGDVIEHQTIVHAKGLATIMAFA
mgnify:CR=1 FL=1